MTSDESLDKNEREKIMNDIKSNYDNVNYYSNKKLDKFSNYKKLRKDIFKECKLTVSYLNKTRI